jgi:hypothetical protein
MDIVVFDLDGTGSSLQIAGQNPVRGGFASAIGTQEPQYLALLNFKTNIIHRADITIVLGEIVKLNHAHLLPLSFYLFT